MILSYLAYRNRWREERRWPSELHQRIERVEDAEETFDEGDDDEIPYEEEWDKSWRSWTTRILPSHPRAFENHMTDTAAITSKGDATPYPLSLVELEYLKLSSAVRNKLGWTRKLTDPTLGNDILEKWKVEAEQQYFKL
ncbi:hypothetical protein BJ742DRAFT_774510 [Cladochytrium replicatum]|nr:hypothetical protein BJ742DRAFT_774510 [Cladochytrium replicatum]